MSTTASGPVTLRAAHELLTREWPGRDAPGSSWLAYYRRAVALYELAARTDAAHCHEALYWAGQARADLAAVGGGHE